MYVTSEELTRFEAKYEVIPESGCWLWTAALWGNNRYGCFGTRGRMESAHKVSLRFYKGIDTGPDEHVCHKCDVTICVNPDHLFVGSASDNMIDMVAKGRQVTTFVKKLTDEELEQARSMRRNGEQVKRIAVVFGMSPSHMSRILKGCLPKGRRPQ